MYVHPQWLKTRFTKQKVVQKSGSHTGIPTQEPLDTRPAHMPRRSVVGLLKFDISRLL